MNYCSNCGTPVTLRVPDGDTLPRHVCPACESIFYHNPKIVTGCVPETDGGLLLCRRAIEPRYGYWTLPAGFMENGETVQQAAIRETWEESAARVELVGLYALFNIVHVNQVYMMFRARVLEQAGRPGHETLEIRVFDEPDLPWGELAFPVIRHTLEHYFRDRASGDFPLRTGTIDRHRGGGPDAEPAGSSA